MWGSSILQRFSFLSGSNCIVTGMLSFFRAEASPVTAQLEAVRKSSVRTYKIVIFSHSNRDLLKIAKCLSVNRDLAVSNENEQ